MKKYWISICLIVIILASFLLMLFAAKGDSMVVDEKVHISAGYLHFWQGNYTFNSEHPPLLNDLAGLFAKIAHPRLPLVDLSQYQGGDQWEYGDRFFYSAGPKGESNNVDQIVFWARFPFILLTLGLIYLVFLWAKTLFGAKAGLAAAALIGFEPNILAHGHLATTDIGVIFFFVLTVWLLRKYILKPLPANAFYLGLAVALTILSKFSGLLVLPIVFVGLIFLWSDKKINLKSALWQLLILILTVLVVSWLVYAFSMRAELAHTWFWAPIDKFVQGYQILAEHNRTGHWGYLNGAVNSTGWWYYFPLTLYYKLTIPFLILILLAALLGRFKNSRPAGLLDEFLIIFPVIFFLAAAAFTKIDIGIRHVLVVVPFFAIFVSRLANSRLLVLKFTLVLLVISQVVIGISIFPKYIAYFNQIAGGPSEGIKHLDDSNLDWNQNMKRFAAYYQENNFDKVYEYCWDSGAFSYYGMKSEFLPTTPVNGVVVVCAHQLKLYKAYGYDISWVTNKSPDEIVADTMYVWRFDQKNSIMK